MYKMLYWLVVILIVEILENFANFSSKIKIDYFEMLENLKH